MMRPSTTTTAGGKPNATSASASSPSASSMSRNAASPTPASVRGAGGTTRKTSPPPTPTSGSKDALSPASSGMYPSPSASGRRGSTVTGLDGGGATPTSGGGAGNNTHRDPFANTNKSMLTTMSGTLATTSGGGGGGSENIKVYVRLRDYNAAEKERWIPNDLAVRMGGSTCEVTVPGRGKFPFTFDECFWSNSMEEEGKPYADQCDVYDAVGAPLVANVMAGFNSSIIAYGQTGSGKTYSIFGLSIMDEEGTKKGLIPRVCDGIFARLANEGQSSAKYTVSVTMLEVYLEEVFDLLNSRKKLAVRQDTATSFGVVGAKSQEVKNYHEVLRLIEKGDSHKTFAATAMNERSSRAHTLFQLVVSVVTPLGSRSAKVMLADLAGCERIKIAKTDTGTALDEACNINLSLLTLGTCIEAAVLRSKQGKSIENMGEFRQSTLTKLLKDFIGGNSRTAILVAIAPALKDVNLTLQALRFADRAKQITTHAKINYVSNKDGPNNKIADEALKTLYDNKKELLEKEYQLECAQNELRVRQDEVANTKIKLDEERRVIAERCKLAETSEEEKKMLLARVSEIEQTMKDMTQELIDMEKEKESMREKILEVCQDNAAIVSDKEVLERRVNELQLRLQDLEDERNDELVAAQDKNYMLTQEVERLEEKLQAREAHHARLAEEAKAAHEKALQELAEAHKKALEAKEADMNSKIAALEKQLNASRQQCFSLTASLEKKTSEYEKLEKDTAAASADKESAHKRAIEELNTTFNAKVSDLEAKLAKVHDDLKKESAAKIATEKCLFDLRKVHEDTNKAQKDEIASLTSDLQKSVDKAKKDAEAHNEALAAKTAAHKSAHQALISLNGSLGQSLNSIAEAVAAAYDEKGQLAFTSCASLQQAAHANAVAHTDGLTQAHDKAAAESAASSKTASEKAAAEHKAALKEKDDRVSRRDATIKDLEAKAAKKAKETEATIASMTAAHAEEVARLKGSASESHAQQRGHADALAAEANAAQEMLKAALEKFHAAMATVPTPAV